MVDPHQSYDDFQLDALLQFDLDIDDENDVRIDTEADSDSFHSKDIDKITFDDIYDSIPEVVFDNSNTDKKGSLTRVTIGRKGFKKHTLLRVLNSMSTNTRLISSENERIRDKSRTFAFMRSVGMLLTHTSEQDPIHLPSSNPGNENIKSNRGVVRKLSNRTAGTTISSDDVSRTISAGYNEFDDDSSSVCYIESDRSWSQLLAHECFDQLNCSMNTFETGDFDESDVAKRDISTRLYRSLPMIESRGLVSLLLDSDDDSEVHSEEKSTLVTSETCEKNRRPYTICEF